MPRHLRRAVRLLSLTAALLVGLGPLAVTSSATALPTNPRAFSCTGSLGEAFTTRTVAGLLTASGRPYEVTVTQTSTGVVESTRHRLAGNRGPSPLHAGYTEWNVTGPNPDGNVYWLSIPPVLPGAGGYFDADLDIEFAGGANGGWQIPMFDCTVTGGPSWMVHPRSPRAFSCTGGLGEAYTFRTVAGLLNWNNRPYSVTVTQTSTGVVESYRAGLAGNRGPSWLHPGYTEWNVTGPNPAHNLYWLSTPPVLPGAGGYFDADLDLEFAGGANGALQIPMFDCTVSPAW